MIDGKNRFKATVKIDGSVASKNLTGSIHQVGARIQGLPSCNGWDFWHIQHNTSSILLDEVREKYRNKKLLFN